MEIFKAVESLNQFRINPDKVHIVDPVFRLFSKLTVGCLFLCAGLVTMQSLVGDKLKCVLPPKEDVKENALNQFCFIMSTYTVPRLFNGTVGREVIARGVGPSHPGEDHQYHYYYQWVPIVLFFQGWSFLIPYFLWKVFDGNRIKTICDLDVSSDIKMKQRGLFEDTKKKEQSINTAASYIVGHLSFNKSYAIFYIICEILNLCIVLFNFWLTNVFLSNSFSNYGPQVLKYLFVDPDSDPSHPMNIAFPKVAKCDFHKFGPSGNIITYDILCILALNIINEKIYFFLWFLFVIMSVIGGCQLIYRALFVFLPGLRANLLHRRTARQFKSALNVVLDRTGYSDWFLLKCLSDNIDSLRFGELCEQIKSAMIERTPNGRISSLSSTPSYTKNPSGSDDEAFMSSKPLV